MKKSTIIAIMASCVVGIGAWGQSVYPGQFAGRMAVESPVQTKVQCFDLKDVTLLDGRVRQNLQRDSAWMSSLAADRIVHSFRNNAGVFASREGGYMTVKKLGGWESLDCDLRGHSAGHLMSGLALMYAATGAEQFKAKGDSIVNALAIVQQALGNGYLSAYPEELINRNIAGQSVWAPWYTLHKILSGLIDQYLYAENEQALQVARGMGDWAYAKLKDIDEPTRARMLRNEFGGVNEAFYNLYAVTGDDRYQWLGDFFYHNEVIDPLKDKNDDFGTRHTNTFIPKVLGEVRKYELTGDGQGDVTADFFMDEMLGHHAFITGSLSDKEHFFAPADMHKHLTGYTGETCCTYNMLKLARHLFCLNADPAVADYYERALYNHILGQQDPATGMVCYFLPLLPGGYKLYSTPENSFWCCVGSGFESHAKYAESIYFHNGNDLYVNLFIPSRLQWKDKGMTVTQTTDFPVSDATTFSIDCQQPTRANIKLRYPSWSGKAVVKVNGKPVKIKAKQGGYIDIDRTWRPGDVIEAVFPQSLRVEPLAGDDSRAAVMHGPIVLAGQLGDEGVCPFSDPAKYNDYYTYDFQVPAGLDFSLEVDPAKPMMQRKDGTLEFTSANGQVLRPLYDTHRQRYTVYWNLLPTSK